MNATPENPDDEVVNSQSYWNQRFASDWESNFGREQSRFFSRLALNHLPNWLVRAIKMDNMSICDWGCAQGDGTDVLAEAFPGVRFTGVDFSFKAIERATAAFPRCDFVCEDFLASQDGSQFDVVFSSNTLEHFAEPWDTLAKISARARSFLVLLLPFREYDRHPEHFSTFDFNNVQVGFNGWVLAHSLVIDGTSLIPNYWNGEQVLLIYTRLDQIERLKLSLSDVVIQSPYVEDAVEQSKAKIKRDAVINERDAAIAERNAAIAERNAAITERDTAITERDTAIAERDTAIAERCTCLAERDAAIAARNMILVERDEYIKRVTDLCNSSSWRITSPLRFATRIHRYGFLKEDRQKLTQKLRQIYHGLPLPTPLKGTLRKAYHKILGSAVQPIRRQILSATTFQLPTLTPAAQQGALPDYFIWGVIDWHFRHQRPQQLAQAIAQSGRRVFYISVDLKDDARCGFDVESLNPNGRLFQIKLYAKGAPVIYTSVPGVETITQLRGSIGEVMSWADSQNIVSIVQHPFWYDVAMVLPNSRSVYDCMDHHEGFGNTASEILALEHALLRDADLTITTSEWLDNAVSRHTERRALIRNAGDFDYFSREPSTIYRDSQGRRIIGYYGAIAEWFDQDLVEALAEKFPDCCILLVGADTVNAKKRFDRLVNIKFIGEVSYTDLPQYLHAFDVCLLPFKVIPLTLATNPVKVYEYLSAGKPVVSVALPEIKQFGQLVKTAEDIGGFVAAVDDVLNCPVMPEEIAQRKTFAKDQTWSHRVEALIACTESTRNNPKASIIVVTYNNLDLTRVCLASLDQYSQYDDLEVIVVDNASSDDTRDFLTEWSTLAANRTIILNDDNRGFAAANNQGLAIASGEYLVLLNNDTCVTPGWIGSLIKHMQRDKTIGLIGPVTNNIGNEAKINIAYEKLDDMVNASSSYTRRHIGQTFSLHTAAFFCVMMSREVYQRIGPLDEAFGRGFFEDDDYCRRVQQIGLRIVCAEDVFIHHHLSASFNKLKSSDRQALFEANKMIYEAKWGKWESHAFRKEGSL